MQHPSESIWLSPCDDGWGSLCLIGYGLGIICNQHHPHLSLHRSHNRWALFSFSILLLKCLTSRLTFKYTVLQVWVLLWTSNHPSSCWTDISVRKGPWPMGWLQLEVLWLCAVYLHLGRFFNTSMAGVEASWFLEDCCSTAVHVELSWGP